MKHGGTDVILKNGILSSRKKVYDFFLAPRSFISCFLMAIHLMNCKH